MVDNCGRLINEWDRGTFPGLSAYFLENGLMLRTFKANPLGPFNSASNAGGLELVDWDNNTVWSFQINTATALSHHDAVMMPNGHILMLTWEIIEEEELISLGRDPNEIAPEGYAWNEKIIEIEPLGSNGANILWEWRVRDHYIQDFDATKENFGVVAEHPELFNINLPDINSNNSHADFDYNHFNAIDYNEDLDQILVSVRNSDEIWILDHSTTTGEAASHAGGNSGKGGDILYRYGNVNAYDRGPESDQVLFGQHGVNWIDEGLPGEGKIILYNNGNGRPGQDYSEAEVIIPPTDSDGNYIVPATGGFGPAEPEWSYGNLNDEFYYSPFLSNTQRLPNGNTLINAGSIGSITEVNEAKEIVWQYEIPLNGNNPVVQGTNANGNSSFRAYRYGLDYPGFEGIDLTPGGQLEIDNNPAVCMLVSTEDLNEFGAQHYSVHYDAINQQIIIDNPEAIELDINVVSIAGQFLHTFSTINNQGNLAAPLSQEGIYILQSIDAFGHIRSKKFILLR